jgi:hypothetical protein
VQANSESGGREIHDADLKGYLDALPQDKLMQAARELCKHCVATGLGARRAP